MMASWPGPPTSALLRNQSVILPLPHCSMDNFTERFLCAQAFDHKQTKSCLKRLTFRSGWGMIDKQMHMADSSGQYEEKLNKDRE